MIFEKPNIIISKCINFDNCRYNGQIVKDEFLKKLSDFVNFIPVCPEVAIGLSTPRLPLRIIKDKDGKNKLIQPATESDLTEKMEKFSIDFLKNQKNIDGFILKNRSPSCGIGDVKVYEGTFAKRNGVGFFAKNVNTFFENIPKEDEGRLKNFRLREDFLTKIFLLAKFRKIKEEGKISDLSIFQAENKYLFMSYSPQKQKELGRIVASYNKENEKEVMEKYHNKLLELVYENPRIPRIINALSHIFGYFKKNCSKEEKEFFLENLESYKNGNIPISSLINILKTWALRDKQKYILSQTILNPFPKELIELSDSGKILKL